MSTDIMKDSDGIVEIVVVRAVAPQKVGRNGAVSVSLTHVMRMLAKSRVLEISGCLVPFSALVRSGGSIAAGDL